MTKTNAMEKKAMAAIISLAQRKEKFTLSQKCLPILNIHGTIKTIQKSKLWRNLLVIQIPTDYIALVEIMWRLATSTVEDLEKDEDSHG